MMNTPKFIGFLILVCIFLASCTGSQKDQNSYISADALFQQHDSILAHAEEFSDSVEILYAKGLKVSYQEDGIHVSISNPDPAVKHAKAEELIITKSATKFICTTALQLGNFEVLGLEDRIVGMNSLKNLFSPKMRQQMKEGTTVKIGKEGNFDLETIIATQPEFIFVSASKHGGFEALKECEIPLISHHGYKEVDPLGQAEWIKLIGLLTGETRRANAVFADIEKKYLTLKEEIKTDSLNCPTVISGRQIRDGWYVVGGKSYMAQIFKDAGADYILKDNEDSGGTTLDFEAVYARGINAEFWQIDSSFDGDFTLDVLANEDARYATMNAYKNQKVIFCNLAQTPYRELAGVQPHFVLADFAKAFHPEILPNYQPKFYKLIK